MFKKLKSKAFSSFLAAASLSLFLLGNPAAAEQKPKTEIVLNYEAGNSPLGMDYGQSFYAYESGELYQISDDKSLILTESERENIAQIMKNVEDKNINSYLNLVEASKALSLNEKLAFLTAISGILYEGMYDHALSSSPTASQDIFFSHIQDYLETKNKENFGICRNFPTYVEKLAIDIGLKAASVTGTNEQNHIYDIIKAEDAKTAIVDGEHVFIGNTKNIEKLLESYQRENYSIIFDHLFFEDSKFKYHLITKNGKNLLDFIGYDESTDTLKCLLASGDRKNFERKFIFSKTDSEISAEADFLGAFAKLGEFYGNPYLPVKYVVLQSGYKNSFSALGLNMNPEASIFYAFPSNSFSTNFPFVGISGSFLASIENKKGINLSARLSGNSFLQDKLEGNLLNVMNHDSWTRILFYDAQFQAGVSYIIPIQAIALKPYLISKFNIFPSDMGTYAFSPFLSELNSGIELDVNSDSVQLSFIPYYAWRIWEQEFGGEIKAKTKNLELSTKGYFTKSNYEFCPDKNGIEIGLTARLDNLEVKISHKNEFQNYGGELDNDSSFSVIGKLKF